MHETKATPIAGTGVTASAKNRGPRYPLGALERAVGIFGNDALSRHLNRSPDCVAKLRSRGLSWVQADEVAVAAGLLPYLVWPEWANYEPTGLEVDADVAGLMGDDIDLTWEFANITIEAEANA